MIVINSHGGLKSFRGLHSHRGLKSFRGLSGGGLRIPTGAKFYYLFSQSDLNAAITDQVGKTDAVITTRASTITIPQTSGGTLEFAAGEAAFDVGQNMQVHPSGFGGATADTRAQISMLDNPSWMIDSPSDNGGVNPCVLGDFTNGDWINGVNRVTGQVTFLGSTVGGKYDGLLPVAPSTMVYFISSGKSVIVTGETTNNSTLAATLLNGEWESFEYPAKLTVLFAYSIFNTDYQGVKNLREAAGDDLTGWSTPTLISDNAGGFKIELDIPDLDHNTGSCVLWKSGDSSLEYDATAGELQSKVAANTAVLALPDLSTAQKVAFKYDGTNIYASADDVDGIGVATTASVLDATGDILQDGAGGGYADKPRVRSFECSVIPPLPMPDGGSTIPFIYKYDTNKASLNYYGVIGSPSEEYDFMMDWGDGTVERIIIASGVDSIIQHTYDSHGIYTIAANGFMPRFVVGKYDTSTCQSGIVEMVQWGDMKWETTDRVFFDCINMVYTATDTPDLSVSRGLNYMFTRCHKFNANINNWDVSNIANFEGTFYNASTFNQPLNNWVIRNDEPVSLKLLLVDCYAFNQDLSTWDVRSVTHMDYFLKNTAMSTANVVSTIIAWAGLASDPNIGVQPNLVHVRMGAAISPLAQSAQNILTGAPNYWDISV